MNSPVSLRLGVVVPEPDDIDLLHDHYRPFLLFAYYAHIKAIEGISNANMTASINYLQQTRSNFENYLETLNDQMSCLSATSSCRACSPIHRRTQRQRRAHAELN